MDDEEEMNSGTFSSLDSTSISPADSFSYSPSSDADLKIYPNLLPINKISLLKRNRDWHIKARVQYKSGIKTWSKITSKGRYFKVHLTDETDTIIGTAYNEACDLFHSELKLNEQYLISRCYIKPANRNFNHLAHNYELNIEHNSSIVPLIRNNDQSSETLRYTEKIWTLYDLACELKDKIRSQIFYTEGTIIGIKTRIDKVVYKACPSLYCKKKVVRTNDLTETYYCVKCDEKYSNYEYRFMLPILIGDWTGALWITMFDDAERFLGISAENIVKIHETNYEKYQSYFKRLFESYTFMVDAGMKIYDEEPRVNGVAESFEKVDVGESCRRMIEDLKRLTKLNELPIS